MRSVVSQRPFDKPSMADESARMTLADLKVGEKVTIHYSEDGDKLIAHEISHVDETPKKK